MGTSDTLFVIPARGGSKGLPRKNILPLGGKPMICYTIDAAREMTSDENICVSTEDPEILQVVNDYGLKVPFIRPFELATDTSGTYEVLLHALDYYEKKDLTFKTIVLLQATSPFRTGQHIKEALMLYNPDIDMVVSVKETKSNPYFNLLEEDVSGYLQKSKSGNYIRRQDCPKVWEINGAIYIIKVQTLKSKPIHLFEKKIKYVMDDWSSHDIDTMIDMSLARIITGNYQKNMDSL